METKNLIKLVVHTQQAKTFLYSIVDKDSIKLINTMLIFNYKGTLTDVWSTATYYNACGYSELGEGAKILGPNQPKEEPKKQEELLKFFKDKGFYNEKTNTYEISTSENPIDFGDNNVYFGNIKTKGNLQQDCQNVGNDLWQDCQKVGETLYQGCQDVKGNLFQDRQDVKGKIYQDFLPEYLEKEGEKNDNK